MHALLGNVLVIRKNCVVEKQKTLNLVDAMLTVAG